MPAAAPMTFVWDDDLRFYDFGPGHPLAPIRVALAHQLIGFFGLLDLPNVTESGPVELATDADLLRVHDADFIEAVKLAGDANGGEANFQRGLGTEDVPIFPGMHEAAARVCGASLTAARAVHSGSALHAVNLAGGLHHAMSDSASGFCVYNDVAVSIAWLLDQGIERVAYVDVDVHHGDGVQEIFYNDPRVMTMSVHESGRTLFPGTGRSDDIGGPDALGYAVNVALPAGTRDAGWLRAFDAVVPELLRAFRPQILVSQHGCDSHKNDPLAHFNLTIEGQRASYLRIHELAHELCGGKWIATGGGGYDLLDAVPRAWTHLTAIAAGAPIDPSTPVPYGYRTLIKSAFGSDAPELMGDGTTLLPRPWSDGYDPVDRLDMAIVRCRDAIFPKWGLESDPFKF